MTQFNVKWSIELSTLVEAKNADEAITQVENLDCQNDGAYVEDSFEIVKVEPFNQDN